MSVPNFYSREALFRILSDLLPGWTSNNNLDDTIRNLDDDQIYDVFNSLVPESEQTIFATNYGLNYNALFRWMDGGALDPQIRNALQIFLTTGVYAWADSVVSATYAFEQRDQHPHSLLILVDGDNLAQRLYPFLAVLDDPQDLWAISCFRLDTIPPFIGILEQLYPGEFTWHTSVFSETKSKDAADTALSGLGMMLVRNDTNINCLRKVIIVSNDGFSIELRAQMEDLSKTVCMQSTPADFEVYRENPKNLTQIQRWVNLAPKQEKEATAWVITLLRNFPQLPVRKEFEQLVKLIRASNNGQQLQKKIGKLDSNTQQDLMEQFQVLLGLRFLTSDQIEQLLPEAVGYLSQFPEGYTLNMFESSNFRVLPRGVISFLYPSTNWDELLSYPDIQEALGIQNLSFNQEGQVISIQIW